MPLAEPTNAKSPVLSHFSLKGKIAAVTGGARGIGVEVCRALAEAGADVALIYTSSKDADETAAKIASETGSTLKAYRTDVRNKSKITATINQIAEDFGRLDICVANAGIVDHHDSLEYSEDDWRRIVQVNLDGAWYTAQAAGNIFKKQGLGGGGSMIFTASVSAILVNIPQKQAPYNATKAAVVHLAKSLAVEWVDFARVNCISPGFIATDSATPAFLPTPDPADVLVVINELPKEWADKWYELVPGGRFADAAELKGAYVFLASDASSYMTGRVFDQATIPQNPWLIRTCAGANLVIDGGYTLP